MNVSLKDLVISGILIITITTVISNLYSPVWGLFYAGFNIAFLTSFSIYKDYWNINNRSKKR